MPTPYLLPSPLTLPHQTLLNLPQAGLIKKSNNNKWNNHNPRGCETNPSYQKSVPAACYARFERAEAAHQNGMENAPFFVGAVLAGNMVGVDACKYPEPRLSGRNYV
jgi:uncharacterized MAPEG superfamily protein